MEAKQPAAIDHKGIILMYELMLNDECFFVLLKGMLPYNYKD